MNMNLFLSILQASYCCLDRYKCIIQIKIESLLYTDQICCILKNLDTPQKSLWPPRSEQRKSPPKSHPSELKKIQIKSSK